MKDHHHGFLNLLKLITFLACWGGVINVNANTDCPETLDFTVKALAENTDINLCQAYKGKVVLIVNTASKCGYTPQYEGLEALYENYRDQGLVVLGFPSNDFAGQEPGTEKQIQDFCRLTYGVKFPMFAKTTVREENADAAAKVLSDAGFEVSTAIVDVSSRESVHMLVETATAIGIITGLIHAAGVSPTQASPATILKVDLYGTALVLEEFGNVIAPGGAGVVIASQSGHRLPALTSEQDKALATTPADELLALPMLQPDQVTDSLHAYQVSKL